MNPNLNRPQFTLIQGGKADTEPRTRTSRCACDESDVYDGYAECPVHPGGGE